MNFPEGPVALYRTDAEGRELARDIEVNGLCGGIPGLVINGGSGVRERIQASLRARRRPDTPILTMQFFPVSKRGHTLRWAPFVERPELVVKFNLDKKVDSYNPGGPMPTHPNLAEERSYWLTRSLSAEGEKRDLVTLAPNLRGRHRNVDTLGFGERMSAYLGMMQGNQALHRDGWVHGDVKAKNGLLLTEEDGSQRPILNDLDGARKATKRATWTGPHCSKYLDTVHILKDERARQLRSPLTTARDVFAWAVLLVEACQDRPFKSLREAIQGMASFNGDGLKHPMPAHLVEIVQAMAGLQRRNRPSLEEVIPVLRPYVQEEGCARMSA